MTTALTEPQTMEEAQTVPVGKVASIIEQAFQTLNGILTSSQGDAEWGKVQVGACQVVFNEFLQAPQIQLPHPAEIFGGNTRDEPEQPEQEPQG